MTTKVTISYDCGHSFEWSLEDVDDVNHPTDSCPLCRVRLLGEDEED